MKQKNTIVSGFRIKNVVKNPIIIGTFFLTSSGLITKLIGFFYRIFLSRIFQEEGLGIIGLVSPVIILAHSICSAGIQNAITRYVAASRGEKEGEGFGYLIVGIFISVALSLFTAWLVFVNANYIALHIIGELRCVPLLRISALSFPLATIHCCINGYFYGKKRAAVPAASMLVEQLTRVFCVYFLYQLSLKLGANASISFVCIGMLAGEFTSAIFSCIFLALTPANTHKICICKNMCGNIISLAFPISLNRVCISFISTIETLQIPKQLINSGLSLSDSLSVYGVFSGMAFPLIMFPSALTGAVSSLLLPSVSEAQISGNNRRIKRLICITSAFCFALGIGCMIFFWIFADLLGTYLFASPVAASQIRALSFVCPFLYMSGALCSILHGLGKTGITFLFNLSSILLRLLFVFIAVPAFGFSGYLYGILFSQILFDLLIILALKKYIIYN
ncbi:MAG: oligosaccharide flippase family protein [Lachnospiraceae bacterium]|nr:oligosaccharide flippase family protein [Lachnospiraceae bacterium]